MAARAHRSRSIASARSDRFAALGVRCSACFAGLGFLTFLTFLTFLGILTVVGCGNGGSKGPPPIVGGLRFVTQPDTSVAFGPLAATGAAIEVEVVDDLGVLIPDASDEVTLSLGIAPGHLILHAAGGYMADPNPVDLNARVLELIDPSVPALRYVLEGNWRLDSPTALAWDPTRERALLTNRAIDNIYSVEPRSGAATLIGNGTTDWIAGLGFEPGGAKRLLAAPNTNGGLQFDALYALNPASGQPTFLGAVVPDQASIVFFSGLAICPDDGTVYATATMNDEPPGTPVFGGHILLRIDADTLEATFLGDTGTKVAGLACSPDGTLYAITAGKATPPRTLMTVDEADGQLTPLLTLGHGNDGEAITVVPPRLHGSITATAVDGVATFDAPLLGRLMIDAVADGYTLIASAPGRADEESMAFDVEAAPRVGVVQFTAADLDVAEGDGTFTVTVEIDSVSETDVYATAGVGGTASDVGDADPDTDLDYLDYFQIVIPAGELQASATVTLVQDDDTESEETITFGLHDASLAAGVDPIGNDTLVVTIADDDTVVAPIAGSD